MKNPFPKIKQHVKDNKKTYIACGVTAVVVGGVVYVIVSRRGPIVINDSLNVSINSPKVNNVIVEMIERSTKSKPVHLEGTNLYFNSLSEAARETGHPISLLSRHINGHIPDIKGDVFTLLQPAA